MKKILMAMTLVPLMAMADTWTDPETGIEWSFTISDGKATVGSDQGASAIPWETFGAIEIPSTLGGCPVTSIGWSAFFGCSELESVTIPEGVTNIGDRAFENCYGLRSLTVPNSMAIIGTLAFSGCSSLTSVAIPNGVTSIGELAFCGCSELTSVTIPSGVTNISSGAFEACHALSSVTIPAGVVSIGECAFDGCDKLTSVTIPSSVKTIGEWAFGYSTKRIDVESVSAWCGINFEGYAFRGNGEYEFYHAGEKIENLFISEEVTRLGEGAFYHCGSLTSVTIAASVASIGNGAFCECHLLKDVYFKGNTHPVVGKDVFLGCDGDLVLHVPHGWTGRSRIFGGAYVEVEGGGGDSCQTYVTTTNIVVQYVLNSVQPEFAIPATSDTGFVNIITEVKGGAFAVPSSWADNYPSFTVKFGSEFTKALAMKTGKKDGVGNDMLVWQDYVAGTDPTNEGDVFKASITIVDGKVTVSYSPELDDARKAMRKYTTWGKKSLLDASWREVPEGHESEYNFFKVAVEMR